MTDMIAKIMSIYEEIPKIFTIIIGLLLSLDTIRALLAMLGWISPDWRWAWIFYGRYERTLILSALKDLGYSQEKSNEIVKSMRKISRQLPLMSGVREENADIQLVLLLANYIEEFPTGIQYGDSGYLKSNYYIDTMEILHHPDDLKCLNAIMLYLLKRKGPSMSPDVIITPKGGHPLFAQSVAMELKSTLLVAKSGDDKSRIAGNAGYDSLDLFKINYEGSWNILQSKKKSNCIVLDCNTSDGNQLLSVVVEINTLITNSKKHIKLKKPKKVFVLFCTDGQGEDINHKFIEHEIVLIRFFDIDESIKQMLYEMKSRCNGENRRPSFFNDSDKQEAEKIIEKLKTENKYYY